MRRENVLFVGLVTVICMLTGVVVGVAVGNAGKAEPAPPPTATRPAPTPTPTPIAQISILLLGVDAAPAPKPRLEGCWVLTFERGLPQYYLAGFSPATLINVPGVANARTLQEVYGTDLHVGRGTVFTRDALRAISPGLPAPQYEVVFDRQALAATVDALNGIPLRGEWMSGDMLLARYDAIPPDNPLEQLAFQGEALEGLLKTAQKMDWSSDAWQPFLNLGQQWKPDAEAFAALAEMTLPTAPEAEFYISLAPLSLDEPPAP